MLPLIGQAVEFYLYGNEGGEGTLLRKLDWSGTQVLFGWILEKIRKIHGDAPEP